MQRPWGGRWPLCPALPSPTPPGPQERASCPLPNPTKGGHSVRREALYAGSRGAC